MAKDSKSAAGEAGRVPNDAAASGNGADYKVGPGFPPKEHQWKKGNPSPNRRGRPRKSRLMLDVKKTLEDALNREATLNEGERKHTITMAAAGIEQLVRQFAKGDRYARRDIFWLCEKFDVDLLAGQRKALEEALAPNYRDILDTYVARRSGPEGANTHPREFAPAALLDDDALGDPTAPHQEIAQPQADAAPNNSSLAKRPIEPVLHQTAVKVSATAPPAPAPASSAAAGAAAAPAASAPTAASPKKPPAPSMQTPATPTSTTSMASAEPSGLAEQPGQPLSPEEEKRLRQQAWQERVRMIHNHRGRP